MAASRVRWRGALVFLTAASFAGAEDQPSADRVKAAAEEFDAGRRAYNSKEYDSAAVHFENADRDAPAPEAIRNAIRAHNDAKHFARAATLAAAALVRYPGDKVTSKLAKQVLAANEKQLFKVQVRCSPACVLLVDSKLAPFTEATELLVYVEPGAHKVIAGWSDERRREQPIDAQAGKDISLSFEAPKIRPKEPPPVASTASAPVTAEPPPPPARPLPRPVFFAAAGLTVAIAGVALWSNLDMRSDPGREKVRRDCAGQSESCPTYQDALSKQTRTNVLLAVTGGVAVATGVVAYFTDWSGGKAAAGRASVRPSVAAGQGWYLGAEGRF